jgi:cytosine/adenosine deaminase-related metal-dependent hydrolase
VIILRGVELLGASGLCDVVVEGRTIREISPTTAFAGNPEIVFDDSLAFPGLINSHDHLEFDCYDRLDGGPYPNYIEWGAAIHRRHSETIAAVEAAPRALRVRLGVVKNLICGVTSVAHHGRDPECPDAPIAIIGGTRVIHSPRLDRLRGMLVPDRRAVVVHIGEGVDKDSEREIDTFLRWNVWRKTLIGVHAIAMRPNQAERFAAIVWCPLSNEFLFGRTAPISRLKQHTVILFGTDSTLTATWNIWDHLRRARELGELTDDELIATLTTNAARSWNLPNQGRIIPGSTADIVVARKRRDDQIEAFFAIDPEDILLVLKDGAIVLLDASLRAQLPDDATFFRATVNGVEKLAIEDYTQLAASLRAVLPSIPVPIASTDLCN